MKNLLHLSVLSLSLLAFSSCGEKGVKEDQPMLGNPNAYSWSDAIKPAEKYSEGEMEVAKRVCESFQQKRSFVVGLGQDLVMDFRVNGANCGRSDNPEQTTTARMRVDRTGQLELVNQTRGVNLMEDVLSDVHPRIKPFCDEVLAGRSPSNTIRDGLLQYQVTFFQASGYEWIQVAEFRAEGSNYLPYLIERAAVSTSYSDMPANTRGFVKIRGLRRPCPNRQASRTQTQEWL